MKLFNLLISVLALAALAVGQTDEVVKVKVIGDRVNLRTKPDLNSSEMLY